MSKGDHIDQTLKKTIELGKANQSLIPQVRNWCKHVVINDMSGGLVAEIYHLPLNQEIACPHSSYSTTAMNFEWIARDFILKSCIGCKYHSELLPDNFGRKVLKDKQEFDELELANEKHRINSKVILQNRINELIKTEKKTSGITELSILKMIESLDKEDNSILIEQIVEAAKSEPDFFSLTSIEVLSYYFLDEVIGKKSIEVVIEILIHQEKYPDIVFQKALESIHNKKNFDQAAIIINHFMTQEVDGVEEIVNSVINNLWYKRHIGESYDSRPSYPVSINLLNYIAIKHGSLIENIFNQRIITDIKNDRINICYLLQELTIINASFTFSLLDNLVKSLECFDDQYEDSADRICCETIACILNCFPEKGYGIIKKRYGSLTDNAKIEFLNIHCFIIKNTSFPGNFVRESVEWLVSIAISNIPSKIREEALQKIYYLAGDDANIFINHFDVFLGHLVKRVSDLKTFIWQKAELSKEHISTFNPLLGKSYWEVHGDELRINKDISNTRDVIVRMFKKNPEQFFSALNDMIAGLNSKEQEDLKTELISLINKSCDEKGLLIELIPNLYKWILDFDSLKVRYAAMEFLRSLIDKHPQIVPKTLIDLSFVFLKDIDVGIKGDALKILRDTLTSFPNEINKEHIDIVIDSLSVDYKYIHKTAVSLCRNIKFFLNEEQKQAIVFKLMSLEQAYLDDKDPQFSEKLIDNMLFLSNDNIKLHKLIVENYVVKYCGSSDYHTSKDFIKKLSEIVNDNPIFQEVWIITVIEFLKKTKPDTYNPTFDYRKDLYDIFYTLNYDVIKAHIDTIIVSSKFILLENGFGDMVNFYSILSFFEFHEQVIILCNHVREKVEKTQSTEFIHKYNNMFLKNATIESEVQKGQINLSLINS